MRRLIMSRLIWIYAVCKGIMLLPVAVKELNGRAIWLCNIWHTCKYDEKDTKLRRYHTFMRRLTYYNTFSLDTSKLILNHTSPDHNEYLNNAMTSQRQKMYMCA